MFFLVRTHGRWENNGRSGPHFQRKQLLAQGLSTFYTRSSDDQLSWGKIKKQLCPLLWDTGPPKALAKLKNGQINHYLSHPPVQAHPEHQKAAVLKDTKISTQLLRAADGGGGDNDGNHDNYGNGRI